MITTQLGVVVKCFHSNNGKEFFNYIVNLYFIEKRVIHESSFINTPQQNGLAKRRIGYMPTTIRALLFQAHM